MEKSLAETELAQGGPPDASGNGLPKRHCSVTYIRPRPGWKALNVRELWHHRELLYFLTRRDVTVRYKQALLGASWAILQPVMYMVVFTIVFSRMADVPSDGIPYPLFSFAALLPWTFFATAISQAGNSVVSSTDLITKVYFPRLAIPIASVGAAMFDFFMAFGILVLMIGYYWMYPEPDTLPVSIGWSVLLVVPLLALATLAALGVGTLLAALNVAYRDFKYTIPFLIQLWMFATPSIYMGSEHAPQPREESKATAAASATDSTVEQAKPDRTRKAEAGHRKSSAAKKPGGREGAVPDYIQNLLKFNPMTGLIRSFRAAILNQQIPWTHLGYSTVIIIGLFFAGCFYFHRVEDTFADII